MTDRESIAQAVEAFGSNATRLASMTLKDACRFYDDIKIAINDGHPEELALAAHSLKSILRQVGAVCAADAAYELEKIGKSNDLSEAQERLRRFADAFEDVKSVLETF